MSQTLYDVGGVTYPRPFRIRRLGHFGFNLNDLGKGLDFYGRMLGFRLTDETSLGKLMPEAAGTLEDDRLFFMTHNTDHHSFLLAHRSLGAIFGDDAASKEITLSQITWQVGSLQEVVRAFEYFGGRGIEIRRSGRDMPGSNWHVYVRDPDGHTIELYYGMEQIGVGGRSKPFDMYYRRFGDTPPLPQMSDFAELADAKARGIDTESGYVMRELGGAPTHEVEGVMLPRPFKITKIGPMALFVADVAASEAFYREVLGFTTTETVDWRGQRCVFMRHGNEHHSLKLLPRAIRDDLGLSAHTSCASMGMQVGSYRQLREAVAWLKAQGARFVDVPAELSPGIDYCAHVQDPEGHCVQLFYAMEQVGWDGRPRPAAQRRAVRTPWPETLEPMSDTYVDQTYMGPLG
jgi:catechol 2,3-dioxygenase-like lactoylglutathione lyase family enzyme